MEVEKEAEQKKECEEKENAKEEVKKEEKKEDEKPVAPIEVEEEKPAAPVEVESEEEEDPAAGVDFEGIDIFGVENVCDIGGKMPLFKDFLFEDFALLGLRMELHLLAHAFVKDVNDPDRTGVPVDHVAFYYQKYFGKLLNFNSFGVQTAEELVRLVSDTIYVPKTKVLQSLVPAELESWEVFAKVTECARRHRALLVDMGRQSA